MADEVIYERGNVRGTSAIVWISGISYPVSGITSVYIGVTTIWRTLVSFVTAVGILGFMGAAVAVDVGPNEDSDQWLGAVLGGLIGVAIMWWWTSFKELMIGTAGGERQALRSHNIRWLREGAIEEAIERRARGGSVS